MLVVRNVLFLAFAANGLGDPDVNLVLITTIVLGLQGFMWLSGRVYKSIILDIQKPFSLQNLGMDYFHTSQQSRSSSRSDDCCLHNHNNLGHHFHAHSMLQHLECYHNITNCQESHQETSQTTGSCSTGRCSKRRLY